jgi:hypothetical protein
VVGDVAVAVAAFEVLIGLTRPAPAAYVRVALNVAP